MNPEDFKQSPSGRLVTTLQGHTAFVPNPLPPPQLDLPRLLQPLERATLALGELNGIGRTLANPSLLIQPFSRIEAVASSRIEGTFTSVEDLVNLQVSSDLSKATSDTREVQNYVLALEFGLKRLEKLPVSKRLIQQMHEILLKDVAPSRGARFAPGEFKKDQNWIGAKMIQNARYVPPPPELFEACLDDLEKYINLDDHQLPLLIRLALIHYQFEAIHPFPDGNGRLGRLLIPMILCEQKAMSEALLYLSTYFERNFTSYTTLMYEVSKAGRWEDWIVFFLDGVAASAKDGIKKAHALQDLHKRYREMVQASRSSALLARLVDFLFSSLGLTIPIAADLMGVSYNSAKNNVQKLVELKILKPGPADFPQWFYADEIMSISFADEPPP